jgi:tRNA threonylcarbamoyladenosine biosynthesis protein TsaE
VNSASHRWTIERADASRVAQLGAALAARLPATGCLTLDGELGAGKTFLVQALAEAAGISRAEVTSPTFVLVQHYQGRRRIHHVDLYRVRDEDELAELGLDELLAEGLLVIEWAQRFPGFLPAQRLAIRMEVVDASSRRVEIEAFGTSYVGVAQRLALAS